MEGKHFDSEQDAIYHWLTTFVYEHPRHEGYSMYDFEAWAKENGITWEDNKE